jgi:hypothetical protein
MVIVDSKPYTRAGDLAYLAQCIEDNDCCAVVGVSNIGKSSLIRQIQKPDLLSYFSPKINDQDFCFVYIDFNLQLQMTGQGFYELVLRIILTKLKALQAPASIIEEIEAAYRQVIAPTDEFQNALNFNRAIITLCEKWPRRLVLLFDEFDEVFHSLDTRVFLNLRALRDKDPYQLMYIVVVDAPLSMAHHNTGISEFVELFTHHTYYLQTLEEADIEHVVHSFATQNDVQFSAQDIAFITAQAGGHPGLLEAVCQVMAHETVNGVPRDTRLTLNHLADNANVRLECVKLWNSLSPTKQESLLNFIKTDKIVSYEKRILVKDGILTVGPQKRVTIFGQLFEDFVRRQKLAQGEPKEGIVIDIDSGHVHVDGKQTDMLTNLEYRLLLLLYGNLGKICDKYRIVEAVWGEDYIEEVDDARIEKLVSRLRQKIEPDPAEPKYLITIRGRGYRLQDK